MDLGNGLGHLTYSTLVHPGDTWPQMYESLRSYLPRVKQRVSPDKPFGICLRLSASSARTLAGSPDDREALKAFLAENDMYVYTVNAFPYGAFKGQTVKEQVYEPDWRSDERVEYTTNVADVLADVVQPGSSASIQSPPLGFKPRVTGPEVVASYTRNVLGLVAHLVRLREETGRMVTLALEPEPYCFLETTRETVEYFEQHLYSGDAARTIAALAGIPVSEAHGALRQHVGVVFDICHQAVEYEHIPSALDELTGAGVPIMKLQEAAALHVPEVTQEQVEVLKRYAETIYLTQTFEMRDGSLRKFLNVEDAIAAWEADPGPCEWRVHIHVPVFIDDLGAFGTTRFAIAEALQAHAATPLSRHLEIETYTWDMLPAEVKTGDIVEYVCREIEWVRDELLTARATSAGAAGALSTSAV